MNRQTGAALITALFIMALVASAAVLMEVQQSISIKRMQGILNADDAYFYHQLVLGWASNRLRNNVPAEMSNQFVEKMPIYFPKRTYKGITIEARIDDMQGLFNLNNLSSDVFIPHFQRLIHFVDPDLKDELSFTIANATHLWIKQKQAIRRTEREHEQLSELNQTYANNKPPYQQAHMTMSSPSELRLVEGVNAELFLKLRPFICALPSFTAININNAPAEVIATMGENGIDHNDAIRLAESVSRQPFTNLTEAVNYPAIKEAKIEQAELTLTSSYFLIVSHITIAKQVIIHYSLIQRKILPARGGPKVDLTILWESQGTW